MNFKEIFSLILRFEIESRGYLNYFTYFQVFYTISPLYLKMVQHVFFIKGGIPLKCFFYLILFLLRFLEIFYI